MNCQCIPIVEFVRPFPLRFPMQMHKFYHNHFFKQTLLQIEIRRSFIFRSISFSTKSLKDF